MTIIKSIIKNMVLSDNEKKVLAVANYAPIEPLVKVEWEVVTPFGIIDYYKYVEAS